MSGGDHPQFSDEAMCPPTFYKDAKTRVFWDVDDYPIPDGLDPAWIYQSIKGAMEKQGFHGEVTMYSYADKNTTTFSEREFKDAGFEFEVVAEGGKHTRFWCMFADIALWALNNPAPTNVIVLAKINEDDLASHIRGLCTWHHRVLLSQGRQEWRTASFLTSIFHGSGSGSD